MKVILLHDFLCYDCGHEVFLSGLYIPWCCSDYMTRSRSIELELDK